MSTPLLTAELKSRLPELYSQEDAADPTVQVLLCGANGWLWALTEYSEVAPDGCEHLAFGFVFGDSPELGFIPMDELGRTGRAERWMPPRPRVRLGGRQLHSPPAVTGSGRGRRDAAATRRVATEGGEGGREAPRGRRLSPCRHAATPPSHSEAAAMFVPLSCLQPVFVDTASARGADSPLVRGYGIARAACPANASPDDPVTVELWVPGADLWATIGDRTFWSSEREDEDEWERAGECPAIVSVPRRDVRTVDEVGLGIGYGDFPPERPA